ncbi:MAG: hypothetical protein IJ563_03560 [Selenomonadaceae bacterium]|nr:hypothetical protein [Selenomonadaceae bacterium]
MGSTPPNFVSLIHFDNADDYCDVGFYDKTILLPTIPALNSILMCLYLAVKMFFGGVSSND